MLLDSASTVTLTDFGRSGLGTGQPQYNQTERDYAMAEKYGSQKPGWDAVMISMGRHVGTTPAVEAGTGWDISQDRNLDGTERVLKGAEATTKLAGNAAMVAGMMPSLRHMPISNPFASAAEGWLFRRQTLQTRSSR